MFVPGPYEYRLLHSTRTVLWLRAQGSALRFSQAFVVDCVLLWYSRRGSSASTMVNWMDIPIINLIVDAAGTVDEPPHIEQLKDALNTVGLLSALLLTVAMAIPGSVGMDDMLEAVQQFNCSSPDSLIHVDCDNYHWRNGVDIVNRLSNFSAFAFSFLASSLMGVVLILLGMQVTGGTSYEDAEAYHAWWKWIRAAFCWILFSLVLGCPAHTLRPTRPLS
jgi:hypothetical protein